MRPGLALFALGFLTARADAQARPAGSFAAACGRFAPKALPYRAEVLTTRFAPDSGGIRARCVVRGRIVSSPTSTINFRIDLPAPAAWNGKTLTIGGGGFDGVVSMEQPWWRELLGRMGGAPADVTAFVTGGSDSGHQGRGAAPSIDYTWSVHNPTALENHASEANHRLLGTMVAVSKAFYGKAPTKRYMFGLSNGGRQGLMAAQRHPEDYDGILALAPAISQTVFAANLTPIMQHIYAHPDNWLDQQQLQVFQAAELAACDRLDGLEDGVISDYHGCRFDPSTIVCKSPGDSQCLTPGQAESMRLWMGPKRVEAEMADGLVGYARYGPGGRLSDFAAFLFGTSFAARDAFDYIAADNIVKTVTDDPVTGIMRHDPARWSKDYLRYSELIDATSPDLSTFAARGGRLIIIHGTGDYCVTPERTSQWFETVCEYGTFPKYAGTGDSNSAASYACIPTGGR